MRTPNNICPCCWRAVESTRAGNIAGHFDKARNTCPASSEPYVITLRTAS